MAKRVKYFPFQKGVTVANELSNAWVCLPTAVQDTIRGLFVKERLSSAFLELHDCISHLPSNDARLLMIRQRLTACDKSGQRLTFDESRARALRLYMETEERLTYEQRCILACLTATRFDNFDARMTPLQIIQAAFASSDCDQENVRLFEEALRETIRNEQKNILSFLLK
jgi:hypothetical protein